MYAGKEVKELSKTKTLTDFLFIHTRRALTLHVLRPVSYGLQRERTKLDFWMTQVNGRTWVREHRKWKTVRALADV